MITELYGIVRTRYLERPQGSYTTYLFTEGTDKILKKVGEEATEVILAAKNNDHENLIHEYADLTYHLLVLLVAQGVNPEQVVSELKRRAK